MTTDVRTFFPLLKRQVEYPKNADGSSLGYAGYREYIAVDCQRRCVYCDVAEDEVGGAESMHLDHFRPRSLPEFEHLANDPLNLHYACARCNLWKSNKWPAQGTQYTHDGINGFVDPFSDDRSEYFSVKPDGQIETLKPPASYLVKVLHLEREFLRKVRERRLLKAKLQATIEARKVELRADIAAGIATDQKKFLEIIDIAERICSLVS